MRASFGLVGAQSCLDAPWERKASYQDNVSYGDVIYQIIESGALMILSPIETTPEEGQTRSVRSDKSVSTARLCSLCSCVVCRISIAGMTCALTRLCTCMCERV